MNWPPMQGKAKGLLSMLHEADVRFQKRALEVLDQIVEIEWPQIADDLESIVTLGDDPDFPEAQIANLLVAKVYYLMGDIENATKYALLSENRFDPTSEKDFASSVASHCIKKYNGFLLKGENIPNSLNSVVQTVIRDLISKNSFQSALCLAIECRTEDFIREILSTDQSLVHMALDVTNSTVNDISYKQSLIKLFVETSKEAMDKFQLCQLYYTMNEPHIVSQMIRELMGTESLDDKLLAYQIAFDLAENALQEFRAPIIDDLSEYGQVCEILTRKQLLDLYLQFLFKNNRADIHALVALKETLRTKRMIVHSSVVTAYSFMYSGTGDDNFYRNNTYWFAMASKWAQYTTIAAVGTIHIGHLKSALQILEGFLSESTPSYALGGGLFALGLIYANFTWDRKVLKIILKNLKKKEKGHIVKHGGAFALGLVSLGTKNKEYVEILENILRDPQPEAAEAAGYAIGLVMLGCGSCDVVNSLYEMAKASEHEKVIRGISMGLAFMFYGLESEAETMIESLLLEKHPILREGAAWVTSLAYVGTSSNLALKRLLHLAVSDVNQDVRRAAVIGVGFVLSKKPNEVPAMVELLAKSYHPHVRNGAALAIGISCAGTGNPDAINLLKPLLDDLEDFVKQSAMIAMAMVLMQQSDVECPYAKEYRTFLRKLITHDRTDLTVFGLCLAYGILNASGRNVVISLNSLRGDNSVLSTVGVALFCNYFYWQPLSLCLALAFHPTAIIGLDVNFNKVDFPYYCGKPESFFANPPSFEQEREVVTLAAAEKLSISKDEPKEQKIETEPEPEEDERDFCILQNPCRVTINQLPYVDITFGTHNVPIVSQPMHGVIMLKPKDPNEDF